MVREGYKQTAVGEIPDGWSAARIKEVCTLINGRGFKPHEWGREGLPIIRIQNLNGSEEFNFYAGYFNDKIHVRHGQLLFAWSGSKGTSFGPHVWKGQDALWGKLNKTDTNVTTPTTWRCPNDQTYQRPLLKGISG